MNTGQTTIEHNLRILDSIIDDMGKKYHSTKNMEVDEDDQDAKDAKLAAIAGKVGYLVNISIGSNKTLKLEERIDALEEDKDNPVPASVRKEFQFNPDIMLTVIRDQNGKLLT